MTEATLQIRALAMMVRAAGKPNVLTFRGSTETPASDGGVLIADGADFSRFQDNPCVQWNHGMTPEIPVIGRCIDWRYDSGARAWDFDIEFAVAESDLAARVYRLAEAGFIRAASVGFEVTERADPTPEETSRYNLGKWGWIGRKWKLHELSLVPVGADPKALKRALDGGAILAGDSEIVLATSRNGGNVSDMMTRADAGALTAALDRLVIAVESLHTILDQPADDELEAVAPQKPAEGDMPADGEKPADDMKGAEKKVEKAADAVAEEETDPAEKPETEESEETGGGEEPTSPSAEDDEEDDDQRSILAAIDALRDRVSQKRGATSERGT